MFPLRHQKLKNGNFHGVSGFESEFPPYTNFIVNRLIINSHERVMPDWNIIEIKGLFFEFKTRRNFNQFFSKRVIYLQRGSIIDI